MTWIDALAFYAGGIVASGWWMQAAERTAARDDRRSYDWASVAMMALAWPIYYLVVWGKGDE